MEQEKKCKNCKYFIEHYVKDGTHLFGLGKGHCINDEIPRKIRNKGVQDTHYCDKWESDAELKRENKENIKNVLKSMLSALINIENTLSED